jgi:glutamate synthase (ferredoxin)
VEIKDTTDGRENRRKHMFNPTTISKLQQAVRTTQSYKEYSTMVNDQSKN